MDNTEETLEIPENAILRAIENLSKKFAGLEKNVNIQFEVIREGIVYNSAAFDRLEARLMKKESFV